MNPSECPRELEVLEAVTTGRWPDGCDEELRAHAAGCAICSDEVVVSTAMMTDAQEAMRAAEVPASGAVWWRMQRRQRAEAARTASRVITFVQISTVVAALSIGLLLLGGIAEVRDTFRTWLMQVDFAALNQHWALPIIFFGIAATLLIAPVALYLTMAKD